jgi:hypothetical protein
LGNSESLGLVRKIGDGSITLTLWGVTSLGDFLGPFLISLQHTKSRIMAIRTASRIITVAERAKKVVARI